MLEQESLVLRELPAKFVQLFSDLDEVNLKVFTFSHKCIRKHMYLHITFFRHPAQCLNFAFLEARLLDEGVSCVEWKRVEEIKDEDILRQWLGRERSDLDELSDSDLSRTGN